ncbi:lantibiotic biosynthesis protein, partial [Lactobacillus reuteri]|nr:lantibiotic biosynthesis protein [Limosilactobacillus reuteri]
MKKTGLLEFIQKLTYKSEVSVLELVLQSKSPDLEKQKILDYIRNLITNEFLFTNLRKVAISHKDLDDLTNILKDINNQRKLTEDLLQIKNSIEQYAKLELGEGISQYT